MIQLGIRFHDTRELPFEERLKEVKDQGFSWIYCRYKRPDTRICHVSKECPAEGRS